jgi:hypothetical protein
MVNKGGSVRPITIPFSEMYKQTRGQANEIIRGEIPCPICSDRPVSNCICGYYRELYTIYSHVLPAKYRAIGLKGLQASEKSYLRMDLQARLYDELRANPDTGWAFFAPAGYSKTTCSYALYRRAIEVNLQAAWVRRPGGFGIDRPFLHNWGNSLSGPSPFGKVKPPELPYTAVWRKSVPDLLQQHFDFFNRGENKDLPKPEITVEKIEKAVSLGLKPRVFLEEIDKIKPSEFAVNQLYRIFDAIDRHNGQIVIDSNLSKQQFGNVFGDPIVRRVKENCIVKEFGF